jgi:hypothetical protein
MSYVVSILLFLAAGSAAQEAPPAAVWSIHTVLPGDTFVTLGQRFGVAAEELAGWNGLEADVDLRVGRRLRVFSTVLGRERFRMRTRIKKETTWGRLADLYELPKGTLLALNRRRRGHQVRVGLLVTVYVTKDRWNGLWLDGGVQLASGPGLIVKHPEWAWGRPVTVRSLEGVGVAVDGQFPGSSMVVGDLSKKRGGYFPPHKGHRGGLDADIGLFVVDQPHTLKFRPLKPQQMDAVRTWFLVEQLLLSGRVKRILLDWHLQRSLYKEAQAQGVAPEKLKEYFQYPAKRWKKKGVVRHYKGHRNHLHVRFVESEGEAIL